MRNLSAFILLATAVIACSDDEDTTNPPTTETFSAVLSGAAERPTPVTTAATGAATLTHRNDTLYYTVTVANLSGAASAAHIHAPADVNTAIGVAAGFTVSGTATTGQIASGFITTPSNPAFTLDSLLADMRAGRAYVNVHTAANPSGEIRGQIVRP